MSLPDYPWFSKIERPSRYIGGEVNSIRKDPAKVDISFALAFPDVYDVGMSHLGLKILYNCLNQVPWISAERVFCPWTDLEREMKARNIPLTTLETERPLKEFDIIGFSLQHELCYTNVLTMLDLSGIPIFAQDRGNHDPIVIAGGPACFNPEPVADFFDIFLVGDGEDSIVEVCRMLREARRSGTRDRAQLLGTLRHIPGIYVPSLFSVSYTEEGTLKGIEPLLDDYTHVQKAILPDIDRHPFPTRQVVPFTELVHDRLSIEITRGCTRGCRFCQAGMIYRPVRERDPRSVFDIAREAISATGYDDLSLLSLSTGDYSCIGPLLLALMDRFASSKVAVSLPSLRVDTLDPFLMEQIKRVRKTGFTIAVEAATEDLRRVINKGLTEEDIIRTARSVYRAGWKLIKLYFMVGLPFEEERDVEEIVHLARRVSRLGGKGGGRSGNLNVSVSTFVPKAHTPFMWEPQISLEDSIERIRIVRKGLDGTRVRVKWNEPETSWLEGVFSRGDRRLSRVVYEAWRLGARFDAWGDHFRKDLWDEAFSISALDPAFYLYRRRGMDEIMPWDHIRSGVSRDFLKGELEKAANRQFTSDCRKGCMNCGVCDHKDIAPILFDKKRDHPVDTSQSSRHESVPEKVSMYRLTYTKLDRARYLGHLELVRVFLRAFRRAGLPLAYSQGFHPMPKVSFLSALPVGTESMCETMDIVMVSPMPLGELLKRINDELPDGISVVSGEEVVSKKHRSSLVGESYTVTIHGMDLKKHAWMLKRFHDSDTFFADKVTKKGKKRIDLKRQVLGVEILSENQVALTVRHGNGPGLKPHEVIKNLFALSDLDPASIRIMKTKQFFYKESQS